MRKVLITLLLASAAAAPALAQDRRADREAARAERQQAREDRQSAREERPARVERDSGPERVEYTPRERPERPVQDADRAARVDARDVEAMRAERQARRDGVDEARADRLDQRQDRLQDRRAERDLRQSTRPVPPVFRNRPPIVSNTPQPNTQPPAPTATRRSPAPQWSANWRNNSRYDWYNWRKRNRWLFNLGFYYDPFGWSYSPYRIGWRMWPSYYGSRYWLNDPWRYRLPYAPAGYRWVRYWDDAVLVDTWSGEVVDVIYNFFW